ncbi:hypothetical protein C8F04DRAFT_1073680 [Mycena alexandri]|uniref:Uncharacterized protein n=1 Tax=Mycena alexandri TaxID=1745969 RepID=A0AAD6XCL7_9AGAR|nr:hypothetical protein C8F04DRAFT_1073680 [Mycena alexandri]
MSSSSRRFLTVGNGATLSVLQNPLRTHIESTGEEPFSVPPHWHRRHDEVHVVLKGRMKITQDRVTRIITPADGPILTRAGVVHSLEGFLGEEVSVDETALSSEETTEQKILFFRNLFAPGVLQSLLGTMQMFYCGDLYPALPFEIKALERLFVVVVGGQIAPLFGHKLRDDGSRMDPEPFPPSKKD